MSGPIEDAGHDGEGRFPTLQSHKHGAPVQVAGAPSRRVVARWGHNYAPTGLEAVEGRQ
ncbi:MAG: hypothetical protein JWN29_1443 [Acidimicrobiales bacterium]|jgi:hypothetical protein|nr:hypothetical protein [Acidimicrobiales bacterium]